MKVGSFTCNIYVGVFLKSSKLKLVNPMRIRFIDTPVFSRCKG
jgi:hypothetical protein